MRLPLFAASIAVSFAFAPALAETAPMTTPQVGQTVCDPSGRSLGTVDQINSDGSVRLIYDSKFITLPAGSLTFENGAVKTSLTRKQINLL